MIETNRPAVPAKSEVLHHTFASSNLVRASYNTETRRMRVEFTNGTYTYSGVPRVVWDGLCSAPSAGQYMHKIVKGRYSCERV